MKADVTIKPVVNHKHITEAGIFCPITKKFLGAGVDASIHIALPLTTEVAWKDGLIEVAIKSPQDEESQKEKPVFEMRVKPYTTNYDLTSPIPEPISKSADSKVIKSAIPRKVKEVSLGEALGLALRLKVETEQPFADVAELLHQIAQHSPLTLINLPFPLKTVKDHSMRLMYNPKESNTKNIAFVFGAGYGRKQSPSAVEVISPSPVEDIKKDIKMVLSKIPEASQAVAVNIQAILRSDSQDIKKMMVSVKGRQAYIAEIDATRIVRRPIN